MVNVFAIVSPQTDAALYRKLTRQVWFGVLIGVAICVAVGTGMIGAWYDLGKNHFAKTEDIWEGCLALLATVIISFVGIGLLRVSKLTDKWRVKIAQALEKRHKERGLGAKTRFNVWRRKYAMVLLPLVTVLREGLEAVVFIGGVGLGLPAASFPLAVITGLGAGAAAGYVIYRFGNSARLQIFLIVSTCFLYLIAAGLFSKSVWYFENYAWGKKIGGDAAETGSGPGSYNIQQSVWHVNCCNPLLNGGGGWGIFNSILGWQNSATYGSVISYNLYWLVIIVSFGSLGYYEKHGHWPLLKAKSVRPDAESEESASDEGSQERVVNGKGSMKLGVGEETASTLVREIKD